MSQSIWNLADEIVNSVSDAIKTENYSGLSQKIKNSVDEATADIRNRVNSNIKTRNTYYDPEQGKYVDASIDKVISNLFTDSSANKQKKAPGYGNLIREMKPTGRNELVVCKDNKIPGRISSYFKYIGGIAGTAFMSPIAYFSTSAFVTGILAGSLAPLTGFGFAASIGAIGCTIGGIVGGKTRINKNKRFKIYKKIIGSKGYCQVEELAKEIDKSKGFVKRDLKKMIKEKYFLEAHFDKNEEIFITSNNNYNNYLHAEEIQKQLLEMKDEKNAAVEQEISRETTNTSSGTNSEAKTIVDEGKEYIAKIHKANQLIPGPDMTKKLNTMEDIVTRIFEKIEREPEMSEELRRMMKYYLPTTIKLLDAYIEMDGQPSYGDNNISKSKKEIEDSLDVINQAFGNLFDSLFEDKAWDISSDINTMKTMMKQDGLTPDNAFREQ